jgi:hypothetical protein
MRGDDDLESRQRKVEGCVVCAALRVSVGYVIEQDYLKVGHWASSVASEKKSRSNNE